VIALLGGSMWHPCSPRSPAGREPFGQVGLVRHAVADRDQPVAKGGQGGRDPPGQVGHGQCGHGLLPARLGPVGWSAAGIVLAADALAARWEQHGWSSA
jgi:hypothetical protein